jgi:hypothetical protein
MLTIPSPFRLTIKIVFTVVCVKGKHLQKCMVKYSPVEHSLGLDGHKKSLKTSAHFSGEQLLNCLAFW